MQKAARLKVRIEKLGPVQTAVDVEQYLRGEQAVTLFQQVLERPRTENIEDGVQLIGV